MAPIPGAMLVQFPIMETTTGEIIMNLEHANKGMDELVSIAESTDNSIALAIVNYPVEESESEDQLENCISDIADYFISEIDEKIQRWINEQYLDGDSDEHDYLWELSGNEWDLDSLRTEYDGGDNEITFAEVEQRLSDNLEYYCEVEITHNYAAPKGISVNGYCLGEKEEQIDHWLDDVPQFMDTDTGDRVRDYILTGLTSVSVHKDSDVFYLDFSDTYANLVLKAETMDELFAAE